MIPMSQIDQAGLEEVVKKILQNPGGDIPLGGVQGLADLLKGIGNSEPGLKLIRGRVTAAGAPSAGSGFTATQTATGRYTVTFAPAFSAAPSCVPAAEGAGVVASLDGAPTVSTLPVAIFDAFANLDSDRAFHFVAMGPA